MAKVGCAIGHIASTKMFLDDTEFVHASALVESRNFSVSLSGSLTSVSELLGKQTETMLALREFVDRIANCQAIESLDVLACEAQDLLLKATR